MVSVDNCFVSHYVLLLHRYILTSYFVRIQGTTSFPSPPCRSPKFLSRAKCFFWYLQNIESLDCAKGLRRTIKLLSLIQPRQSVFWWRPCLLCLKLGSYSTFYLTFPGPFPNVVQTTGTIVPVACPQQRHSRYNLEHIPSFDEAMMMMMRRRRTIWQCCRFPEILCANKRRVNETTDQSEYYDRNHKASLMYCNFQQ